MSIEYQSLRDLIDMMDPEIHMNLKTAVELGRWSNGERLSPEQVRSCLQAIIAYEQRNLDEQDRVGYIETSELKTVHCDDDPKESVQDLKWVGGESKWKQ